MEEFKKLMDFANYLMSQIERSTVALEKLAEGVGYRTPEEVSQEPEPEQGEVYWKDLDHGDLKEMAIEMGIKIPDRTKKPTIIKMIEAEKARIEKTEPEPHPQEENFFSEEITLDALREKAWNLAQMPEKSPLTISKIIQKVSGAKNFDTIPEELYQKVWDALTEEERT